MSLSVHDIISLILSVAGFGAFANMAINRAKGNNVSILATMTPIALILFTFLYRFIFHNEGLIDTLFLTLRDVGAGLMTSALWAMIRRGNWKMYLVPGILCLTLYFGYYLFSKTLGWAKGAIQEVSFDADAQNEILVELGIDDDISELSQTFNTYGASAEQAFPFITMDEDEDLAKFFLIKVDENKRDELLKELRADIENVDSAEPNSPAFIVPEIASVIKINKKNSQANDPQISSQWGLQNANFLELFSFLKKTTPKKKAKIAIVDTGVDSEHEDITNVFESSPGSKDKQGHGTHCAGIAGAISNNGKGIASGNWEGKFIEIMGFKALGDNGTGDVHTVTRAILQAAEANADVISLSLGGYHPTPPRAEVLAINYAKKKGAVVVVAAGNSNEDAKNYAPANIPGVIVVSATDIQNKKAPFSNTNTSLGQPIASPGVDILSLKANSPTEYVSFSGTSMATPMVAGLVGLMRSLKPDITADEVYKILNETGTSIDEEAEIGKLINANQAIKRIE